MKGSNIKVELNIPEGYTKPDHISIPREISETINEFQEVVEESEENGSREATITNESIEKTVSIIDRLRDRMKRDNKLKKYDKKIHSRGVEDLHGSVGDVVPSTLPQEHTDTVERLTGDKDMTNNDLQGLQETVTEDVKKSGDVQGHAMWNLPFIFDYNTRNISFLQVAKDLRDLGIKNYAYCLILYDRKLQGVDPHSPFLDKYTKVRIARECIRNPMYFIREVVRITQEGGEKVMFQLNRANLAALYLHFHNIDMYLTIPRQLGKTISVISALLWDFQFGTTNSLILFFNKDLGQSGENLARLKVQRDNLPSYLRQTVAITETGKVDKANNNVKSLRNPANENRIITKPSAMSTASAEKAGRGDTSPIHYYDEVEFTSHIRTITQAAGPSFKTASESAAKNGVAYGRIFTSTPGDLDSPEGKEANMILENTCVWFEKMYDMTISNLKKHIEKASKNGIVYIEYNYIQLGKDDKWLNELCRLLDNDEVKIDREIHLKRMRGAKNSAFQPKDIKQMMYFMKTPIKVDVYNEVFKIDIYSEIDRNKVYVVGVDTSEGGGRDYNALTMVDPTTYKPVLEFRANEMSATEVVRLFRYISKKYAPRAVFAVERNYGGFAIMDMMRETELAHRIYFENTQDVLAEGSTERLDSKGFVRQQTQLRKNSGVWTGSKSRGAMMNILKVHMRDYKDRFVTQNISNDIAGLILKTGGRIDHAKDGNDDSVMSYLIALFVIYHGGNKERFGIVQGVDEILSEEAKLEQSNQRYNEIMEHEASEDIRSIVQSLQTSDMEEARFQEELRKARQRLNTLDAQDDKITNRVDVITYDSELGGDSSIDMDFFDELNSSNTREYDPYDPFN